MGAGLEGSIGRLSIARWRPGGMVRMILSRRERRPQKLNFIRSFLFLQNPAPVGPRSYPVVLCMSSLSIGTYMSGGDLAEGWWNDKDMIR